MDLETSLYETWMEKNFRPAPSLRAALAGEAIRAGTENAAKLQAIREAFHGYARPGVTPEVRPTAVESGVPDQPIGWTQIVAGARNRARAAFEAGDAVIAVGIEDGLVRLSDEPEVTDLGDVFNVGCAFVTDGEREGRGFSSGFAYPVGALEPAMRGQVEIGGLFDDHWSRNRVVREAAKEAPSGPRGGNIGRLTGGRLDRAPYGGQAVICALVRFLHTDLYD